MFGNLIIYLEVFLIVGLFIYFLITLYSYLKKSNDSRYSDIETEIWVNNNQELTIIYKKDNKPSQEQIENIKLKLSQFHEDIITYINQTDQYKKYLAEGITLAGISFPTSNEEFNEFDFSIDYIYSKIDYEKFLTAQFKDGKLLKLKIDD